MSSFASNFTVSRDFDINYLTVRETITVYGAIYASGGLVLSRPTIASSNAFSFVTNINTDWTLGEPINGSYLLLSQANAGINQPLVLNLGSASLAVQGTGGVTILTSPAALNATGTLTAALIHGGIVTSTTAAPVTMTLDTAVNILALYSQAVIGTTIEVRIINLGPNSITIAAGTGDTLSLSSTTIATATAKTLQLVFTNVTTGTVALTVYG
jgi:hypothetical protein